MLDAGVKPILCTARAGYKHPHLLLQLLPWLHFPLAQISVGKTRMGTGYAGFVHRVVQQVKTQPSKTARATEAFGRGPSVEVMAKVGLAGTELEHSVLAFHIFFRAEPCSALHGGCSSEPFGNGETSSSRTPQKIISCHWQQKKVPQFSPAVWEDDVGVARTITPPVLDREEMAPWKYLAFAVTASPLPSPGQGCQGACSFPGPRACCWHGALWLPCPLQPVTQRSCAVLCRALSFPDLLPPSHGPSKTSLAQWPRVVGAGALSTALSWGLVSRSDVAQWKREFSRPSLHNHRHTCVHMWSLETSMYVMCWLQSRFPVRAPCSSSHWDFATF